MRPNKILPVVTLVALLSAPVALGQDKAGAPEKRIPTSELIVNLKTAKDLGLTTPPSVLIRAEEVIQ